MNLDLQDKRALVCGSTQGIGKAVAMELPRMECDVTLLARDENVLRQVQQEELLHIHIHGTQAKQQPPSMQPKAHGM